MKYSKEITALALVIFSVFAVVNYIVSSQDRINRSRTSSQVLIVPDVQEKVEEKPVIYDYEGVYEADDGNGNNLTLKINKGGAGLLESYEKEKNITGFGDWSNEEMSLTIKGDDDKGSYEVPLVLRFSRNEDGSLTLNKELLLSRNDLIFKKKIVDENVPEGEEGDQ